MMIGGAVLNATAFTGGGYLAKYLAGDSSTARLAQQKRHDLALEAYEREVAAWQKKREQYRDWLDQNYQDKMQDEKNFENTEYAFKLYAQTHPDPQEINYLRRKPVFKYTPSDRHKNNELLYVGLGGLAIGAAAGFLYKMMQNPHYDILTDKGPKGDKGERGIQGPKGDKGDTGSQGPKGDKGNTGSLGTQGPKGDKGSQGPKGDKGDKGDTGLQGPKGDKEDKGNMGIQGLKGPQGVRGPKGDIGDTGLKGDQGAKGRQGDKGDKGEKGDTGAQGPAGTFTTPTADVSFGNQRITNLGIPRDSTDAVNKNYADSRYIRAGEQINMGSNRITHLNDPADNNDAVNRRFADGRYLRQNENINLGSNSISTSSLPAADNDLVNKKYVDNIFSPNIIIVTLTTTVNVVKHTSTGGLSFNYDSPQHIRNSKYLLIMFSYTIIAKKSNKSVWRDGHSISNYDSIGRPSIWRCGF